MSRFAVAGLLLVLGVSCLVVWLRNSSSESLLLPGPSPLQQGQDPDATLEGALPGSLHSAAGNPGHPELAPRTSDKRSVARSGLVRVLDSNRQPIAGAVGLWAEEDPAWNEERVWPDRDWPAFLMRSSVGTSNSAGELLLAHQAFDAGHSSRLWVTSARHQAKMVAFSAGSIPVLPAEIVLESAAIIRVRVVDAEDQPAAGVSVYSVQDLYPVGQELKSQSLRRDGLYLVRVDVTNAEGEVALPSLAAPQLCWAVDGPRISKPTRIEAPDAITIELASQILVSGKVVAGEPAVDLQGAEVSVYALSGSTGDRVGRHAVSDDGSFGPMNLPVDLDSRYLIQAQGPGFVASSADFVQPPDGGGAFVELTVQRGLSMPIRTVDADLKPIPGAYVSLLWRAGEQWEKARGVSDAEGYAFVGRAPLGHVLINARAPGYAVFQEPFEVQADVTPYLEVVLGRAGIVRGRVLHFGQPVRDFVLDFWGADIEKHQTQVFRSRKDGSFSLENVAFGDVTVLAVSAGLTRSREVLLHVEANVTLEPITLELADPLPGGGRVVDAKNSEPLAGAVVQAWTSHGRQMLAPFGVPVLTGSDGRFEVRGFASGRGFVSIDLDGYAGTVEFCEITSTSSNDFGVIALTKGASLTVELAPSPGMDPGSVECRIEGPGVFEPRRFPADGLLRFDGLAPGPWTLRADFPGERGFIASLEVDARKENRVAIPSMHRVEVEVEITGRAVTSLPDGLWLNVRAYRADGKLSNEMTHVAVPKNRRVAIGIADEEELLLILQDVNGRHIALRRVDVTERKQGLVRFEIDDMPMSVRILDRDRNPLPALPVKVCKVASEWSYSAVTDAQGMIPLPIVPFDSLDLCVLNESGGFGIIHHIPVGEDGTEVVFDPTARLGVTVHDTGSPVPGCLVHLGVRDGVEFILDSQNTNAESQVTFGPLLADDYVVRAVHPTVWPNTQVVPVRDLGTSIRIDVRRRGSVLLTAKRSGLPVRDLTLDIRSEEFQTSAAEWIRQGLADSSSPTLTTDSDGVLRLDGIPHGRYQWYAVGSDGSPVGGSFTVEPSTRVDVELLVP